MSQEVEIIEEYRQIIVISDDDCLLEEDSKDLIVINNIPTETVEDSEVNTCLEAVHAHVPAAANNTHSSLNTENQCIHLEDEVIEPNGNSNNSSNVAPTVNSQSEERTNQNNSNTNIQHTTSLRGNIASKKNSNESISKKVKIKKRKRKRRKLNIKNVLNKRIGIDQSKKISRKAPAEKESNFSNNNNDQNGNNSILETATCSSNYITPTCSTQKDSDNYDFSKLKWLRPLNNLSSPPRLQLVIIDRSHPFWRIDTEKWLMIEKRLLEALNSEMLRSNDTSIGLFDGAKWQRGIKIVGCHNENALDFIMKFIVNLDKLWCGAKLDAFPISSINHQVVKVYIPPPTLKTELTMSLIKLQNPSICTKDWQVIRELERPNHGGVDIWMRVNDESFTELRKVRGEIKYGINRIWLKPSH